MNYCPRCRSDLVKAVVDGRERLRCSSQDCSFVFWDNPVPVVAALVEYGGGVLLARNAAWPPGMYSLITGFLEKDEAPEDGALREVREELGLNGQMVGMIGAYAFPAMNQLILAYHVAAEGAIKLSDELVDVKRIPVERLKAWPFGTGLVVRDWLARRTGSGVRAPG